MKNVSQVVVMSDAKQLVEGFLLTLFSLFSNCISFLVYWSGQGSDCVNVKGPIIGGPFTLVNTENKVVTEKDFLGNWVLLYFGYTSSPDVGPEQLKLITKALNTLGMMH
jgi:cytochrome oxidase Cu insertion factor (SCO1/SenC/PrrC family)